MNTRSWTDIALPVSLLLLGAIPVGFSAAILIWLATDSLPEDSARYALAPLAISTHALGGLLFGLLGPLQFAPRIRARWPRVHRICGRAFVAGGGLLSISGLAMLARFPDSATWVLQSGRFLMAFGVGICLTLAVLAARARNIPRHRAYMIRGYAIGMAAGTQALVLFPYYILIGEPVGLFADLILLSGWIINITVAEWAVRRTAGPRTPRLPAPA